MPQRTDKDIERALRRLGNAWKRCPQLRLCQLIENALGSESNFFVEDSVAIESIERYAANVVQPVAPRTRNITDGDWP